MGEGLDRTTRFLELLNNQQLLTLLGEAVQSGN